MAKSNPLPFHSLACLGFILALGCGAEPPQQSPEPEPAPAPAPVSACDGHSADFRARMATATGSCTSDAECGCFNPVVGEAGCGGITDRASSDALGVIEATFHADACPWPHRCAPWACEPACREGRCVNAGMGGRVLP